jgi:regulator of protease activity HflC (stomatin/prohibitin superfamily)
MPMSFFVLMSWLLIFGAVLLILGLVTSVRIANQYERAVIFRLGKYSRTMGLGLYLLIPLVEWQRTIDMRTMTTAVEQQEAIARQCSDQNQRGDLA